MVRFNCILGSNRHNSVHMFDIQRTFRVTNMYVQDLLTIAVFFLFQMYVILLCHTQHQSVRLPLLSKDLRNFPPLLGLPGSTGQVGLASTQCSPEAVT